MTVGTRGNAIGRGFDAAVWLVLTSLVVSLFVRPWPGRPAPPAVVVGVFLLVGAALVVSAIRAAIRAARFGRSTLTLDPFPAHNLAGENDRHRRPRRPADHAQRPRTLSDAPAPAPRDTTVDPKQTMSSGTRVFYAIEVSKPDGNRETFGSGIEGRHVAERLAAAIVEAVR